MKNFILMMTFLLTLPAFSKVKVKDIFFNISENGKFAWHLKYEGEMVERPKVETKDNILQIELLNSIVWPKIDKVTSFNGNRVEVKGYQFNRNIVRLRVVFPEGKKINLGNLKSIDRKNKLSFTGEIFKKKTSMGNYDESYLNKLLAEKEVIKNKVSSDRKNIKSESAVPKRSESDSVKLTYSSPVKAKESNFSIWSYVSKFVGFLLLMIGGIYGAFFFLKKGALKKSKINFLNSEKHIEVVSKHFLSHKRSLMLVRVENQVFLVANHEHGMEYLSEIREPGKLLKDVEMDVVGDNFSAALNKNEEEPKEFNLKEVIERPASENIETNTNENSLSMKLKNKIKTFKDVQ